MSPAANSAAQPSALALLAPPPVAEWIDTIVSAVAVPLGNGSASLLISWRLIGIAANTPSEAIAMNHRIIRTGEGVAITPTMRSAPNAAMLPPPVM